MDESAGRVLVLAEKCEDESKPARSTYRGRRAVALKIEEEGIVLLKNDGVLPLQGGKVLVTGAPAEKYYFGGGSSNVYPEREFEPLAAALRREGGEAEYTESVVSVNGHQASLGNLKSAVLQAAQSGCTVLCVGEPNTCEYEEADRQQIRLSKEEEFAIHALARVADKLIVVVYAGAVIDMSDWVGEVDAIVWAGYGGEYVNRAVAEVLVGKVNPSGGLPKRSRSFRRSF
ncbi:MAG: glycoside hydrolase family 3 protein [Christensenellaceae bacterium]